MGHEQFERSPNELKGIHDQLNCSSRNDKADVENQNEEKLQNKRNTSSDR